MKLDEIGKDEKEAWVRLPMTVAVVNRLRDVLREHEERIGSAAQAAPLEALRFMAGERTRIQELIAFMENPT